MEIRCSLCGKTQDETEYTISVNGHPTLISFCQTCFKTHDHSKDLKNVGRRHPITGFCAHGHAIRSPKKNAHYSPDCPKCQKSYYAFRRGNKDVYPR